MPSARTTDGVEIAFHLVGQPPPTLLFMHGWAGSGAYFDETLKHLDLNHMRAITIDFRGHGASGPSESYSLEDLTADVIAVADEARAEDFILVGFSMSGKFAQYVTSQHPERVLGQVLVAGCPVGELPLPPQVLADWYDRAGNPERMIELARSYSSQPVADAVLARFGEDAARVPLVALRGTLEAVMSTSFMPAARPTLVVGGEHDAMFSPEMLREGVTDLIPGATLKLLECGHEIPVERPRELAALIEAFVAELR
jgi:pimeloyl-ACP methyl ester carboxylesterase